MQGEELRVLLATADDELARAVEKELAAVGAPEPPVTAVRAGSMAEAVEMVRRGGADVLLLGLDLPDAPGLAALDTLEEKEIDLPLVVLAAPEQEEMAMQALQRNVQDYVVSDQISSDLLARCLRYALERHRLRRVLRSMSLADELTGLNNRRGFVTKAEPQVTMLPRLEKQAYVLYVDIEDLKSVNTSHGRMAGDTALKDVADILRETFRATDIIARLESDEFAVFAMVNSGEDPDILLERLYANVKARNSRPESSFPIRLAVGATMCRDSGSCSISEALSMAREEMEAAGS